MSRVSKYECSPLVITGKVWRFCRIDHSEAMSKMVSLLESSVVKVKLTDHRAQILVLAA